MLSYLTILAAAFGCVLAVGIIPLLILSFVSFADEYDLRTGWTTMGLMLVDVFLSVSLLYYAIDHGAFQ